MSHKRDKKRKVKTESGEKSSRIEIVAKSLNQQKYLDSIQKNSITLACGPAGCGKTYLAVGTALNMLLDGRIDKILIVRPLVEVDAFGENPKRLGATPGTLLEKLQIWLGSIFDNADLLIGKQMLESLVTNGSIEFSPLALIRGRSLSRCFILVEEAQNIAMSGRGMEMIMTRIGKDSKMVICGDIEQSDLGNNHSALEDAMERFEDTPDFGIVDLERCDIQRSGIIKVILDKYDD